MLPKMTVGDTEIKQRGKQMSRNSDLIQNYFRGCTFGKDYRDKFEAFMRSGDFSMFDGAERLSSAKNAKSIAEKMKFIFDLAREGGIDLYDNFDLDAEHADPYFLENLSSSLMNQSAVATDLFDEFNKSICKTTKDEGPFYEAARFEVEGDPRVSAWHDRQNGLPEDCNRDLLRDAVGVYAKMHEVRANRGFWFALFHPIINARERRIENQMRDTLVNHYGLDAKALDREISRSVKPVSSDPISAVIAAAKNPNAEIEAKKREAKREALMDARTEAIYNNRELDDAYINQKAQEKYNEKFPAAEEPKKNTMTIKKPQRKIRPDFEIDIENEKDETLDIVNLSEKEFHQMLKDVNDHTLYANFVGKNVEGSISKKERDEIEDKIKKEYPDATKEELKDKIDKVVEEVKSVYSMQNRMKDYGKQMNNEVEKQRNALIEMKIDPNGYKQRNEADIKEAKEEISDNVFYLDVTTSPEVLKQDKINKYDPEMLEKSIEKHKQALITYHKMMGNQIDENNPREMTTEEKTALKASLDDSRKMRLENKLARDMQRTEIVNGYKKEHADFFKTIDDKVQIDISFDVEPKEKIDKIEIIDENQIGLDKAQEKSDGLEIIDK